MSFDVVKTTLASAVANAGTFTIAYPTDRDDGDYQGGKDHQVWSTTYGELTTTAGQVSFAFGASVVTITNNSGQTLAANTDLIIQIDRLGKTGDVLADDGKMIDADVVIINLGAPDVADPNGYVATQNLTAAGVYSVDTDTAGALAAAALLGTADVARNVVAAWTGTAVITITGTDHYGNTVVESSGSGTSLAGKKAFKTITGIAVSANVTGLTVGTGDVIGLPVFLPGSGHVIGELQDGAAPTAGTVVAGVRTVATATTGDVRGTYDPNAACDGAKAFQLIAALGDKGDKGVSQYAG